MIISKQMFDYILPSEFTLLCMPEFLSYFLTLPLLLFLLLFTQTSATAVIFLNVIKARQQRIKLCDFHTTIIKYSFLFSFSVDFAFYIDILRTKS